MIFIYSRIVEYKPAIIAQLIWQGNSNKVTYSCRVLKENLKKTHVMKDRKPRFQAKTLVLYIEIFKFQ